MTDADIHAFGPGPQRAPAAAPRRRLWPWLLGLAVLLLVAVAATGSWALVNLADTAQSGLHVVVNGDSWEPALALDGAQGGLALLGLAVALLAVVLVVPLALLLGLTAAALGIGIALLVLLALAAVALSPLWLLALLLWLLLRSRRAPAARLA